jgi:hypothetical protein
MTFVSGASNQEIRERYGFTIDRQVREFLVDHGYITVTRASRAYVHELSDEGWARCRAELSTWPEGRVHRAYRILHGVLSCLDHYLTTADLTLADFLTPTVARVEQPADDQVLAAYDGLASREGAWVGLAHLREALPELSRQDFDAAVLRLDLLPHVSLIPEANQKALTAADRAAAIHAGGDDKHLLSIRPA